MGSTGGQIKADAALLSAVNDARLSPERVISTERKDRGERRESQDDRVSETAWQVLGALDNAAATHNKHVASVSALNSSSW